MGVSLQVPGLKILKLYVTFQYGWGRRFFKDIIYLLLERGEGKDKEGEKHQCVVTSRMPPTEDLARNPGMCPDWDSKERPFGSQAGTQSTEPQQPGWGTRSLETTQKICPNHIYANQSLMGHFTYFYLHVEVICFFRKCM